MMINKVQRVARVMFSKYLLVTNTCTASSLLGLGDCIIQQIERLDNQHKTYNFQRTGRMCTMGLLFGPVTHVWYKILDRYLPGTVLRTVASKILADQVVAGPFFCSAFFMGMTLLEGKSSREGMEEVKSKFWTVYMLDWCIWPPAQFINFFFLPPSFRVVYVSGITLVWNTILSWMKHKEQHVEAEVK
ncbi:mpv17-like protein 2 [Mercenaria mercenaria]|uniref:mpv17-like protein 2 n=1 Tax=Mercenaria mercenaria TaxID=6596 RepID=UPI00234F226F|nr:mpv17-like protein 2 [Mercenaria mercenaria]XP_053394664.1 mpv17-like protein 2 [Mercenaria mercenaria]XP_053394665.1 mpv17-like protein 2 [Mercenaria mercenaria]